MLEDYYDDSENGYIDEEEYNSCRFAAEESLVLPYHPTNTMDVSMSPLFLDPNGRLLQPALSDNFIISSYFRDTRKGSSGATGSPSISNLLEQPDDIILEVLGHLHPIDVYHMALSIKSLRNLVSTPSLWNAVFQNHPNFPSGPPDVPKETWAKLLLGQPICEAEGCGCGETMLDFSLRRRYCRDCMIRNLKCNVPPAEPDEDDEEWEDFVKSKETNECYISEVWELVPRTYRWDGMTYHAYENSDWEEPFRCQRQDLTEMNEKLIAFQIDIDQGVPGAAETAEDFKSTTKASLLLARKQSSLWSAWAREIKSKLEADLEEERSRMRARIVSRLLACGYDKLHLEELEKRSIFFTRERLTSSSWREIKTIVEEKLERIKDNLDHIERQRLLASRRAFLHDLYRKYKMTVDPAQRSSLPPDYEVHRWAPFSDLINRSDETDLEEEDCSDALDQLSAWTTSWAENKMQDLRGSLPPCNLGLPHDILDLATSVFSCPACKDYTHMFESHNVHRPGLALIGRQEVYDHLYCPHLFAYKNLVFHERGSSATASLLTLLNLDIHATLQSDLDKLDLRFICADCPVDGSIGCKALRWRECIAHAIAMEIDVSHSINSWTLLPSEQTEEVRLAEHELPFPRAVDSWSCAHCESHYHNYTDKRLAKNHLLETHSIYDAKEGDLTHYRGEYQTVRRAVMVSPKEHLILNVSGFGVQIFL